MAYDPHGPSLLYSKNPPRNNLPDYSTNLGVSQTLYNLEENFDLYLVQVGQDGPTNVTLADFSAVQQGDCVLLTWETNSELNNRGFNLYRGTSAAGPDRQLNETLIPSQSQGNPGGFVYTWEDRADLAPGTTYFYWVEDVDIYGAATMHGPVSVDFAVPTAVTLSGVQASPRPAPCRWPVCCLALLASLLGALALSLRKRKEDHVRSTARLLRTISVTACFAYRSLPIHRRSYPCA